MPHKIKYTLTFADFQNIMKAKQADKKLTGWKRILLRTVLFFLFLLPISNKFETILAGPLAISLGLVGILLLLALAFVIGFELFLNHVVPRLVFMRQKSEIKTVELVFDKDKLNWTAPGGAGYLNWSSFKRAIDQPDAVVLFFNSMQAFIVPRRAFTSDEDFEDTRHFISTQIEAANEDHQNSN